MKKNKKKKENWQVWNYIYDDLNIAYIYLQPSSLWSKYHIFFLNGQMISIPPQNQTRFENLSAQCFPPS